MLASQSSWQLRIFCMAVRRIISERINQIVKLSDISLIITNFLAEEAECESDREIACPPKRRKQESFLSIPGSEDDETSLSRSSSLLQFETLEKQCQAESPSVFSHFSFESLDIARARREFITQELFHGDVFTFGDEDVNHK